MDGAQRLRLWEVQIEEFDTVARGGWYRGTSGLERHRDNGGGTLLDLCRGGTPAGKLSKHEHPMNHQQQTAKPPKQSTLQGQRTCLSCFERFRRVL